jgi:hypothetical protein
MKKNGWLLVALCLFAVCGRQGDRVEKVIEDGIEVVINGTEPYDLPDVRIPIDLEEETIIDMESENVLKSGLYNLDTFAVDGDGNIYILSMRPERTHIFKFSSDGQFAKSFGGHGQGPGELTGPTGVIVTSDRAIMVTDPDNAKLVYFNRDGGLIREVTLNRNIPVMQPLSNGNFVVMGRQRPDLDQKYLVFPLELCDESLEPVKNLDEYRMDNFRLTRRIRGTAPGFGLAVGGGCIFIGNEKREYEIWVYDQEGSLVRKMRKTYRPLPVTDAIKERALASYDDIVKTMIFFPETLPPFRTMAAEENGWLYVVTFEEGDRPGENRIDVFEPDGAFVGRLSAAVFVNPGTPIDVVVSNGRFYYVRESESGFKQLVVEKIVTE